jgi:predicted TIM-barrel fold metal-dependent hydrolase
MNETFYDIHMHAMNLSHPYLLAFIRRLNIHQILVFNAILSPLASLLLGMNLNKIDNILAVMENDLSSFFLLIEDYLKEKGGNKSPLLSYGKLHIGGNVYSKIVLTPLMMDFGYKNIKDNPNIYYNKPSRKPIVEQVIDVFNGIKKYSRVSDNINQYYGIFEIYPFLGLNTKNYGMRRIKRMLDKYFSGYRGSREQLNSNMGKFDGDIEHLGSNFFAGIKVYPPLGFNPWPDNENELAKVRYLYGYCCKKGIPITAHGSEGGFVVVPKKEIKNYTAISKWERVLSVKEYSRLKLNLAHFPAQERLQGKGPQSNRLREMLNLVLNHENVYVDFANSAVNDKYYASLEKLIEELPGKLKAKLKSRILFGSDFPINLLSIESYNRYLNIFSRSTSFNDKEKDAFCCANPERFLFSKT